MVDYDHEAMVIIFRINGDLKAISPNLVGDSAQVIPSNDYRAMRIPATLVHSFKMFG